MEMNGSTTRGTAPPTAHAGRRVLRFNAALTLALLLLIAVLGNVLAARHLGQRVDLSADQLNAISDATRRVVDRVEDRLTVRLFANQTVSDGRLALRAARVRAQLDEILRLRPEVFDFQTLDPSRSSEARRQAREARLQPDRAGRSGLGQTGEEEVWLGLMLGYRGRTEVISTPEPWRFEVQVASAMHALLSDRKIGIGWIGEPFEVAPDSETAALERWESTFRVIRNALSRRARLAQVPGLATGNSVPDDVDVIFMVRPGPMHEREVYAIDQFVQRGGRLVVCLDDPDYNLAYPRADVAPEEFEGSPLAALLRSWGIRVAAKHVWDDTWRTDRVTLTSVGGQLRQGVLSDPLVITVPPEGLATELPPTRGLPGVAFSWAHPLFPEESTPTPAGVTRTDLAWSSESAYVTDVSPRLTMDPRELRVLRAALRNGTGRRHTLAAVFNGLFPSPWAGKEAPAPLDPLGLGRAADEPAPTSAVTPSQVVVFGDADWLRDPLPEGTFVQAGGGVLAVNLVDWLTLDEDLIGLRSRAPRLRPLRDFVGEQEAALGLFEEDVFPTEAERIEASRKGDLARRRARRQQWLTMLAPAALALLVLALFGALWNGLARRRAEPGGGAR